MKEKGGLGGINKTRNECQSKKTSQSKIKTKILVSKKKRFGGRWFRGIGAVGSKAGVTCGRQS